MKAKKRTIVHIKVNFLKFYFMSHLIVQICLLFNNKTIVQKEATQLTNIMLLKYSYICISLIHKILLKWGYETPLKIIIIKNQCTKLNQDLTDI